MRYAYTVLWKKIISLYSLNTVEEQKLVPKGRSYILIDDSNSITEDIAKYDYVIIRITEFAKTDIYSLFKRIKELMHDDARVIVLFPSSWTDIFKKIKEIVYNKSSVTFTSQEIGHFLFLAGFDIIFKSSSYILPIDIPIVSSIVYYIGQLPFLCYFGWSHHLVARPTFIVNRDYTVSIIVPCKNEKGNIETIIQNMPQLGMNTEIVFVEGNSTDGTYEELERIQQCYQNQKITVLKQDYAGKKDAIKKGFIQASGEILMILDGDASVDPRELCLFYETLKSGRAEFLNGSRLVYPIEKGAMTFTAYLANRGIGICLSWLFNQKIKDALCGTKVLFKKDYEKIMTSQKEFPDLDPFGDFDLLFGAVYHNLKIVDVPVRYKKRRYGCSQISRYRQVWYLIGLGVFGIQKFKSRFK